MRRTWATFAACIAFLIGMSWTSAHATIVQTVSGNSFEGNFVSCEAELRIVGDVLTIKLSNTSGGSTANPSSLLTSYYFDIVNGGGNRPALSYASATGDVWMAVVSGPDELVTPGADLVATLRNDDTWAFGAFDDSSDPFLGFGVGTVGNSAFDTNGNNFNGNTVGARNYSIYTGDVTTKNLKNKPLVKDSATFTFSGVSGFTESDIAPSAMFGLGTEPDGRLLWQEPSPGPVANPVPEPLTMAMLGMGIAGMGGYIRRRRAA